MVSPIRPDHLPIHVPPEVDMRSVECPQSCRRLIFKVAAVAGVAIALISLSFAPGLSSVVRDGIKFAAIIFIGGAALYVLKDCCREGNVLSPRSTVERIGRSVVPRDQCAPAPVLSLDRSRRNLRSSQPLRAINSSGLGSHSVNHIAVGGSSQTNLMPASPMRDISYEVRQLRHDCNTAIAPLSNSHSIAETRISAPHVVPGGGHRQELAEFQRAPIAVAGTRIEAERPFETSRASAFSSYTVVGSRSR